MPAAKPAGCRGWLLPHLQAREEAAAGRATQQDILQSGPWRCAAIPAAGPVAGPAAGAPAATREHPAAAVPGAGMPAAASRALNSAAVSSFIGASIASLDSRSEERQPLWANEMGTGQPLLGNAQSAPFSPLALLVPPGQHRATLAYRPAGWVWGLRLCGLTLAAILALLIFRAVRPGSAWRTIGNVDDREWVRGDTRETAGGRAPRR